MVINPWQVVNGLLRRIGAEPETTDKLHQQQDLEHHNNGNSWVLHLVKRTNPLLITDLEKQLQEHQNNLSRNQEKEHLHQLQNQRD